MKNGNHSALQKPTRPSYNGQTRFKKKLKFNIRYFFRETVTNYIGIRDKIKNNIIHHVYKIKKKLYMHQTQKQFTVYCFILRSKSFHNIRQHKTTSLFEKYIIFIRIIGHGPSASSTHGVLSVILDFESCFFLHLLVKLGTYLYILIFMIISNYL